MSSGVIQSGAAKLDFEVFHGKTLRKILTFKDQATGLPIDLTGYSFSGVLKKNTEDTSAAATLQFTVQNQITNTGEVEMLLTAAESASLVIEDTDSCDRVFTEFLYDIVQTNTLGDQDVVIYGCFKVFPATS